jgi:hypothetical protein
MTLLTAAVSAIDGPHRRPVGAAHSLTQDFTQTTRTTAFADERASEGSRSRSLRNAMKEGLPGGKLRLSPKSELEEARLHVARWIRSQSQAP